MSLLASVLLLTSLGAFLSGVVLLLWLTGLLEDGVHLLHDSSQKLTEALQPPTEMALVATPVRHPRLQWSTWSALVLKRRTAA